MRELTDREVEQVSGSGGVEIDWMMFTTGLALIGLGVTIAGTAGLAAIPVGVIAGAGMAGEITLAAAALGLTGGGGIVTGSAFSFGGSEHHEEKEK